MRLIPVLLGALCLLAGCAGPGTSGGSQAQYIDTDWLYYQRSWYDDDFWIWVDDHPDCCEDKQDLKEALRNWYDSLDPPQQEAVRDRVRDWLDENGIEPAVDQPVKELVLETASERWAALTPTERQQWLDQRRTRIEQRRAADWASHLTPAQRTALSERVSKLSPEQRAALRAGAPSAGTTAISGGAGAGTSRPVAHPTPGRAGLSGGMRFQAARGGGRGGRGR